MSSTTQAFYANRIAKAGLVGIVQSRPAGSTTGFGSIDPLFGTNPIAFSFPTLEAPLVFDMTTSAMTWYGLVLAEAQGKDIPHGVAIDETGNVTTDPSEAMKGALLPFASDHKGASMALVVELLGGVLVGSEYGQIEGEWGSSFIAIDPEVLIGRDEFARRCSHLIDKIKSSRKQPGVETVRLPGERAARCYEDSVKSGTVEVDDAILRKLGYVNG